MKAIEKDFPFEFIDQIAEVESYRKEINRPIYHIHKWWAKRLGSVFRAITVGSIEETWGDFYAIRSKSEQIILDPFMGSGTTLGEATKLGYKAIGCDINPVSTFQVNQALTYVDINDLKQEFSSIEKDISSTIKSYYKTFNRENEECEALYYFWVNVVTTPHGEKIPLFKTFIFSKNAYPKKKPNSKVYCPSCGNIFTCLYDATETKCPSCKNVYNPQEGNVKSSVVYNSKGESFKIKNLIQEAGTPPEHMLYAIMALTPSGEKVYLKPQDFDIKLYEKACDDLKQMEENLPLPSMSVRDGHNTKQATGYNYNNWKDFFNPRQLLLLGILYRRILSISDKKIREQFITLFSSTLEFNNLFCSFKGEGTGAVRHMFSNHIIKPERTPLENNIWGTKKSSGTFSGLFKSKLLKAKEYLDYPFDIKLAVENNKRKSEKVLSSNPLKLNLSYSWNDFKTSDVLLLNGDSGKLPIPDESVDAIITDPPYFDFIHYSELSDFFYAWLSKGLRNDYPYFQKPNSSDLNEVQDKNANSFSKKIGRIFLESNRVLKINGLMCFSYHHSTILGWVAIYEAIRNGNFIIAAAHPVKAEMSVASPKSAAKNPINLDAVLVCKKGFINAPEEGIIEAALHKYQDYFKRFSKINRQLSGGDKFVIICSQILVQASLRGVDSCEIKSLLEQSVTQMNNLTELENIV